MNCPFIRLFFIRLRMKPLLPRLMRTLPLMRRTEAGELVHEPVPAFQGQLRQDAAGGEFLEVAHGLREFQPGDGGVEVIVQDHPRVDEQTFVLAAVGEGFEEHHNTARW